MLSAALLPLAAATSPPAYPLRERPTANVSTNGYQKTTGVGPYPEGFAEEDYNGYEGVISGADTQLTVSGNVRAYWVQDKGQHSWDTIKYKKLDLRGKSLRWTTDVSRVGCACNAALCKHALPPQTGAHEPVILSIVHTTRHPHVHATLAPRRRLGGYAAQRRGR